MSAVAAAVEPVAAAGTAAPLEDIAEERHTAAEEEVCGRKFERRWSRSSCEEEERFEAGLGERRIEAAVAGPEVGLAVAHIAAAVVESAAGHIVGQPVVVRIAAVVVVGTAAAAAGKEERGRKESMTWAVAWQTSWRTEEEEDNVFLAVG